MLADRYAVGGLIGSGGMADVHRGTDRVLERDVAIKLLRSSPANDRATRDRFADEARTIAALNHPHLVTILDAGTAGETPYLVMQLLDGPTLRRRLASEGPMSEDEARVLGAQIADGLAYAHARGIVHRDVKPSNIVLLPEGRAVLTDFGIARDLEQAERTATGEVLGSPAYLAPEQVTGAPLTTAVDVYALGLVLLEAVSGVRAYTGSAVEAAIARLSARPPIPMSLDRDLRDLLVQMTALEPGERPTAQAVAEALRLLPRLAPVVSAPAIELTSPLEMTAATALPLIPDGVLADGVLADDALADDVVTRGRSRSPMIAAAVGGIVLLATLLLGFLQPGAGGATSRPRTPLDSPAARTTHVATPVVTHTTTADTHPATVTHAPAHKAAPRPHAAKPARHHPPRHHAPRPAHHPKPHPHPHAPKPGKAHGRGPKPGHA